MADKRTIQNVDQEWNLAPEESHNELSSFDALVRFIARKAAEADFLAEQGHASYHDIEGD